MTPDEAIFAHARAAPGRLAARQNGERLSYGDFAARIAAVRDALRGEAAAGRGVAVLCIHRPLDAWIVGLALRSLGVTTVHGRAVADLERLALGPVGVVTVEGESWPSLAAAAETSGSALAVLPRALLAASAGAALDTPPGPRGGHILLTSGTTGAYKKVLAAPEFEAANCEMRIRAFGLDADSVVCAFDFGGWTSIGYRFPVTAWQAGAAVVLHQGADRHLALAPGDVTCAFAQPQLLADLLAAPEGALRRDEALTLVFSGGVLPTAQWRDAQTRLTPDVRTCLGATEVGSLTLTRIDGPQDLAWHAPCEGIEIEVVGDDGQPLPVGQVGVVRARTCGVDEYLDDPETSGEFFRDGWFYPGDLGVFRADGRLSLQGRVTDVIHVMGDKIATAPIEAAIQERLEAAGVCVFSAPGIDGEAVHVAIQLGRPVAAGELKAVLAEALPRTAQVLAHAVAAFPRNHMGKIDRAALKRALLGESV